MGDNKQYSKMPTTTSSDVELYKQKIQTLLQAYKEQEDEKKRLQEVVEKLESITIEDDEVCKLKNMLVESEKQRLKKEKILLADRKGLLEKYNESRKELKLLKDKIKQTGMDISEESDITINVDKTNNKNDKSSSKKECNDNGSLKSNKLNDSIHIHNLLIDTKKTFESDSKSLHKKIENLYKINNEKDVRISKLESSNEMSNLKIAELANENATYREKIMILENEIEKMENIKFDIKEPSSGVSEEDEKIVEESKLGAKLNSIDHIISPITDNNDMCQSFTSHKYPIIEKKEMIRRDDLDSLLQELTNMTFYMMSIKSDVLNNLCLFKNDINHLLVSLIDDANDFVKEIYRKNSMEIERLQRVIKEQREEIELLKKYSEICKIKPPQPINNYGERRSSLSRKSSTTADFYSLINDKTYHQEKRSSLTNTEETALIQHYTEQLMKKQKILENVQNEVVMLEGKYNDCLKEKLSTQMEYESRIQLLQDQIRDIRGSMKILQANDFQYIRNIFISYLNTKSNDSISRRNILKALGQVLSLSNVDLHKIETFK
uniref:GRIP domain-containing protein n=1 Tax=Strongyloides papillosus TaxID=174720 RepID=A0A0N5BLC8_STREA